MRSASIVVTLAMVMAVTLSFLPQTARAPAPWTLSVTIEAGRENETAFFPSTIVLPLVPIILNVTLVNNGSTAVGNHTFTINDNAGQARIDIYVPAPGDRANVEFEVNSTTLIYFKGQEFRPEPSPAGGIFFYCVPHKGAGMFGNIVVGGVSAGPSPEIGVFLRAYWIGIIGLIAMLVWTGITYFLIKATSRHHTDHREHVRRGLT